MAVLVGKPAPDFTANAVITEKMDALLLGNLD